MADRKMFADAIMVSDLGGFTAGDDKIAGKFSVRMQCQEIVDTYGYSTLQTTDMPFNPLS